MTKEHAKTKSHKAKKAEKPVRVKHTAKTPPAFKLSIVFASGALVANIMLFAAIQPVYDVIDGNTAGMTATLDRADTYTAILTPIIYASIGLAVLSLIVGLVNYAKTKPVQTAR